MQKRLMVTELARVQTEAQKQSFIQNGFEEYEYIACEKADACSQCRSLDGKVFKVEDMMPGENARQCIRIVIVVQRLIWMIMIMRNG